MKFKFQCSQIGCYWNTALLTHLHVVSGSIPAAIAELKSCNTDHVTHKAQNIYYMDMYRKSCRILALAANFHLCH